MRSSAYLQRLLVGAAMAGTIGSPATVLAFRSAGDLPEFAGTERVRWQTSVVPYVVYSALPSQLSSDAAQTALVSAFQAWSQPACSSIVFDKQGIVSSPPAPGDGTNTVAWRMTDWADLNAPTDAAGLTDVQYEKIDGQWVIVEADLYLNGQDHEWSIGETGATGMRDVRSVATHEAGHFLGLLHPCEVEATDDAPDCESVPGASKTTMYPVYSPGQSTLAEDDEAGVCFLYPAGSCEGACEDGTVCTPEGCRPACGKSFCQKGETCVNDACVADSTCGSVGCDPGRVCQSAADCSPSQQCILGTCTEATAQLGDPCLNDAQCREGECTAKGYCDLGCAAGETDETACPVSGNPLGALCGEANDCLGRQCLAGLTKEPVCTRLCDDGAAACPEGWYCLGVEGRNVCAPDPELEAAGGGCTITNTRSRNGAMASVSFLALLAALLRRRQRRTRK